MGKSGLPKIDSEYCIIDVTRGRMALKRYLAKNGPVRVQILVDLTEPFGRDDGVSIEFNGNVLGLTVITPPTKGTCNGYRED